MFTITSYSDVVAVANTFGVNALRYAMDNRTISPETTMLIAECMAWASRDSISVEEVNDGNIVYSIDAVFTAKKVGDQYFTNLNDITIIRTGFGAYSLTVQEAMERKEITTEQLSNILNQVTLRNKASIAFGF